MKWSPQFGKRCLVFCNRTADSALILAVLFADSLGFSYISFALGFGDVDTCFVDGPLVCFSGLQSTVILNASPAGLLFREMERESSQAEKRRNDHVILKYPSRKKANEQSGLVKAQVRHFSSQ
jgi:hypothetical protein